MRIWDKKCVWDIIWLQDSKDFQDIYKKKDDKLLLDSKEFGMEYGYKMLQA